MSIELEAETWDALRGIIERLTTGGVLAPGDVERAECRTDKPAVTLFLVRNRTLH